MALSGTLQTTATAWTENGITYYRSFLFSWSASQDITANKSTISWNIKLNITNTASLFLKINNTIRTNITKNATLENLVTNLKKLVKLSFLKLIKKLYTLLSIKLILLYITSVVIKIKNIIKHISNIFFFCIIIT